MYDLISKFVLTVICLIGMFAWYLPAKKKFERYIEENPFGDYEQPRTASVLGVLLPLNAFWSGKKIIK